MTTLSNLLAQSLEGIAGPNLNIFYENSKVVTENYTIDSTKNAMSTGPIEIANSVVVTVAVGSRWVIL